MGILLLLICAVLIFAACMQSRVYGALVASWFGVAILLLNQPYPVTDGIATVMLITAVPLALYGIVKGLAAFIRGAVR